MRRMRLSAIAAIAALLAPLPATAERAIVVLLPLHGIDAAEGLEDAAAVRLAAAQARARVSVVVQDVSRGEVRNPHEDEGTDNDRDVAGASRLARGGGPGVLAVVGGSRRNVSAAIASAGGSAPFVTMSAPAAAKSRTFCLCRSDTDFRLAVVRSARRRFGPDVLMLRRDPSSGIRLRANGSEQSARAWRAIVEREHRDAVVVDVGDGRFVAERAPARELLDERYLVDLGHRDAPPTPPRATDSLAWGPYPIVRSSPVRDFERRFRRTYGAPPFPEAAYAFAAAEVAIAAALRANASASVRAALETGTFVTILGRVSFDADGSWRNAPFEPVHH